MSGVILFYMVSVYLGMMGVLFFYLSLYFVSMKVSFMLEWVFFSLNSMNLEMTMIFDWMSMVFISVVLMVSSMVMIYSVGYMEGDKGMGRFCLLMVMFVLSMILMVLSPNLMSILLGWDGLGLTSYCLVMYYQNSSSFNSGMVTVLMNRIGDVSLLMVIGLSVVYGSWNLFLYNSVSWLIVFMIFVSSITKSAQIPFSSWLPKAMAAPTPVSSLVHSSTLVTAGVYLLIRYHYLMKVTEGMGGLMLVISSLTMVMSGIMANFENDLKKIIALSTLGQLGLMMSMLSIGFELLAFFHLLMHAFFKSLLFLTAGVMIHGGGGNQDIRLMGGLLKPMPYISTMFMGATLALCGFPFLSGFYSKDLIMEVMMMSNMNFLSMLFLFLGTLFTVSYSVRLVGLLMNTNNSLSSCLSYEDKGSMNYPMMFLYFCTIFMGSVSSWIYFDEEDLVIMGSLMKLTVIILCMLGVFVGCWVLKLNSMMLMKFNVFMSSMGYMNLTYESVNVALLKVSYFVVDYDKGWLEYSKVNMLKVLVTSFVMEWGISLFMFMKMILFGMGVLYIYYI